MSLVTCPSVATQPSLLPQEVAAVRAARGDRVTGRAAGLPRLAPRRAPGRRRRLGRHRRRRWTATSCRGCRARPIGGRRPIGSWRCGVPATARARGPGRRRCRGRGAEPAGRDPVRAARAGRDGGPAPGGRRRGPRRRRRPRRPRHPVARPDRRGQVNARRGAGAAGRALLLRRVRAHRRRRARAPVSPAAAAAGRVGRRPAQYWRRSWAARWRTSRFRRASSWGCAMPRTPRPPCRP